MPSLKEKRYNNVAVVAEIILHFFHVGLECC